MIQIKATKPLPTDRQVFSYEGIQVWEIPAYSVQGYGHFIHEEKLVL